MFFTPVSSICTTTKAFERHEVQFSGVRRKILSMESFESSKSVFFIAGQRWIVLRDSRKLGRAAKSARMHSNIWPQNLAQQWTCSSSHPPSLVNGDFLLLPFVPRSSTPFCCRTNVCLIKLWTEWENKSEPNLRRKQFNASAMCRREQNETNSNRRFACITGDFVTQTQIISAAFSLLLKSWEAIKEQRVAQQVIGIMQAENLCRFMSPYGNDARRDKELHHHDPRSAISISMQRSTQFSASLVVEHSESGIAKPRESLKLMMKADAFNQMTISTNCCLASLARIFKQEKSVSDSELLKAAGENI